METELSFTKNIIASLVRPNTLGLTLSVGPPNRPAEQRGLDRGKLHRTTQP